MGKRKALSSSSDSSDSKAKKKQKKEKDGKKDKAKSHKDKDVKDKEQGEKRKAEADKDKGDKKKDKSNDKDDKKDKEDKKKDKEKKDHKDKKEKKSKDRDDDSGAEASPAPARTALGPQVPAGSRVGPALPPELMRSKENDKKDKGSKKEKKETQTCDPPVATKEIVFAGTEKFRNPSRPFGMELDGNLVVDLLDQESQSVEQGVQIGWRVISVQGKAVPEEDEKAATKILRAAEERQASEGTKVLFLTEEPKIWKDAVKRTAGLMRR